MTNVADEIAVIHSGIVDLRKIAEVQSGVQRFALNFLSRIVRVVAACLLESSLP